MFVLPMPFPLCLECMPLSIRRDALDAENVRGSALHPRSKLRFEHECS